MAKNTIGSRPSVRALILELLSGDTLLSADELTHLIAAGGWRVNRTSVYRQLQSLLVQGQVRAVYLGNRALRYELANDHHHHIVCRRCETVQHVSLPETLGHTIRHVRTEYGFDVQQHVLELFGLCPNCQD